MALPEVDSALIGALGRAGYVVVPKNCVAPQLLGRALKVQTMPPVDQDLSAIRQAAAERHGLAAEDLAGSSSRRHVSGARQMAMFVAVEHFGKRQAAVARALGRSDHTTVRHGVDRVRAMLADSKSSSRITGNLEWVLARTRILIDAEGG